MRKFTLFIDYMQAIESFSFIVDKGRSKACFHPCLKLSFCLGDREILGLCPQINCLSFTQRVDWATPSVPSVISPAPLVARMSRGFPGGGFLYSSMLSGVSLWGLVGYLSPLVFHRQQNKNTSFFLPCSLRSNRHTGELD